MCETQHDPQTEGMRKFSCTAIALFTAVAALSAHAADTPAYPVRPVRIIVAFAPGGGPDLVARVIAQQLGPLWGQQIVVDNRAGAGGIVGTDLAAKAPADGYTWAMVSSSFVMTAGLHKSLPYNPVKDFAPVTLASLYPLILVAHSSARVSSVQELITLSRKQPGLLNYASSGNGTPSHLAAELFKSSTGVELTHIPYKSAGFAVTDLLGGHIRLMFATLPSVLGHVKSGELKALAIGSAKRVAELPNVPTIAESGVPGYEASGWAGVLTPSGTPTAVIRKISASITSVLQNPDVQRRFAAQGATPASSTPAEFSEVIRADLAKWAKVIRVTGIRVD